MYYVDLDDHLVKESDSKTVYRYWGGGSQRVGGYITDTLYETPQEAKEKLALSDVDWDSVNTADHVLVGTVELTDDGRIIDLEEVSPTDEKLTWSTVTPSSDYGGGGLEHRQQGDFEQTVQVVDEKDYDPYFGYVTNDDIYHDNNTNMEDSYMDMYDDLEYDIQKEDVDDAYKTLVGEEDFITDSNEEWQYNIGDDAASIDDLIDEDLTPTEDIEEFFGPIDDDDDPGRDGRYYGDEL